MAFVMSDTTARTYAPGYFLADAENCERKTRQISATGAQTAGNGGKFVPMGTIYPSNDENAVGIVYEDVDVTTGDMPGSVVLRGTVYEDRLPVELDSDAKTALEAAGFIFRQSPTVTRP
jgi:hypothetical protein